MLLQQLQCNIHVTPSMSVFKKAKDLLVFAKTFVFGEPVNKEFLPKDKMLVLRPDGSWILNDSAAPPPVQPTIPTPSPWYSYGPLDPVVQEYNQVPELHPDAKDLNKKLNDCMAANVITSCSHSVDHNNIYTLTVELPMSGETVIDVNQMNAFIKAMQLRYDLKLARKERCTSSVSTLRFSTLVFEYDMRSKLFKK
jgi:hypothetical protein